MFIVTLIYRALLRLFGLGASAKTPPAASTTVRCPSPVWDTWLKQARTLQDLPPDTGPLPADEAVIVLERLAYPRATVGAPPQWRVTRARAAFTAGVLEYLRVLAILGERFPKARPDEAPELFSTRLAELARTDIETWLAGLFSGQPVTIPADATDVLIQRAANSLGCDHPVVAPFDGDPDFIAYPETQSHVVKQATDFVVFPCVIVCGEEPLVKLPNSIKRFHRETVRLSGWELRTRWLAPVNENLAIQDDEGEAEATSELTPKDDPTVK